MNSFLSTISSCQIFAKTLIIVWNFLVESQSINVVFILLKYKKNISRIVLILVSANQNFFSETRLFKFILDLKNYYNYFDYLKRRSINFLSFNIGF